MQFIDIYCGEPGSLHDALVLRRSELFKYICEHEGELFMGKTFLIGDSAYPSKSWLVPPFKDFGNLTDLLKHHRDEWWSKILLDC